MTDSRLGDDKDTAIAVVIVRGLMVVVFLIIAAAAVYMGGQAWLEIRTHTSDAAQTGIFTPKHCENDRYSAECTGTFRPQGGTPQPALYKGDLDSLTPQRALRLPGHEQVFLVATGPISSRVMLVGFLFVAALVGGGFWLVKRRSAAPEKG